MLNKRKKNRKEKREERKKGRGGSRTRKTVHANLLLRMHAVNFIFVLLELCFFFFSSSSIYVQKCLSKTQSPFVQEES